MKLAENSGWTDWWSIRWYGSIMYLLSFFESWKLMELRMSWVLYKLGWKVVWNVSRIGELSKLLNISICSTSKRSLKSIRNFTKCSARKSREIFRLWMLNVRESFPQILINANRKGKRNMQEWFERYKNFSLHFLFDR